MNDSRVLFPPRAPMTGFVPAHHQIGPALYYITTPIHPLLRETAIFLVDLVRATPNAILCVLALVVSLALVCDGFRASDNTLGARIALTGVLGAVAAMYCRFVEGRTSCTGSHVTHGSWSRLRQVFLLLGSRCSTVLGVNSCILFAVRLRTE